VPSLLLLVLVLFALPLVLLLSLFLFVLCSPSGVVVAETEAVAAAAGPDGAVSLLPSIVPMRPVDAFAATPLPLLLSLPPSLAAKPLLSCPLTLLLLFVNVNVNGNGNGNANPPPSFSESLSPTVSVAACVFDIDIDIDVPPSIAFPLFSTRSLCSVAVVDANAVDANAVDANAVLVLLVKRTSSCCLIVLALVLVAGAFAIGTGAVSSFLSLT